MLLVLFTTIFSSIQNSGKIFKYLLNVYPQHLDCSLRAKESSNIFDFALQIWQVIAIYS